MSELASGAIRELIGSLLKDRGLPAVGESDKLFSTGLLDSMAATEVLVALESNYGVDLGDENLDIMRIDTLQSIEDFLASRKAA